MSRPLAIFRSARSNEDVEICEAGGIWGKDVYETGRILAETMIGIKGCSGGCACACKSIHEVQEGKHKGAWYGGVYPSIPFAIERRFQLEDYGEACLLMGLLNSLGLCVATSLSMIPLVTILYERGVYPRRIWEVWRQKQETWTTPIQPVIALKIII